MGVTVKKIQIIPCGDKDEVARVYSYIRDGIYNQYRILNTYMSQMGVLYYQYERDIKNPEYKERVKEIFRNTNEAIKDIPQAKGLGMAGNCGMKVKSDFSTALKNGLAKGERQLPFYKRDFPLLVPSRFLVFSEKEEDYYDSNGELKTVVNYYIKFVNGIVFKVVFGSKGRRDYRLTSLLSGIVNDVDHYKVCGSSIQISGKKIILNLTTNVEKETVPFIPIKDKKMGIVLGYDQPLVAALSNDDKEYYIGTDIAESIVERRTAIQAYRHRLQVMQTTAKSGHGRKRRMRRVDQQGHYERNVMRNYNHILSSKVVSFAVKNKVETILIDDISKDTLIDEPILLRNWSYYQMVEFITYKAKEVGITVISVDFKKNKKDDGEDEADAANKHDFFDRCCVCGEQIDGLAELYDDISVYKDESSFTCPHCRKKVNVRYNKAKNLTYYKNKK